MRSSRGSARRASTMASRYASSSSKARRMSGSSLAALNWKILKISSVQSLKSAQSLRGVPKQLADDRDRIPLHELARRRARRRRAPRRAPRSTRTASTARSRSVVRGCERLSDEAPESSVLLAVDAEDALADPVPELALGDALRGKCETRGSEVATVANHRLRGLVAQRLDAERPSGERTSPRARLAASRADSAGTPSLNVSSSGRSSMAVMSRR